MLEQGRTEPGCAAHRALAAGSGADRAPRPPVRAEYRTPVEVFQARDGFIVALTYGADTDWLRNIQAAGGGLLRTHGLTFQVSEPRVYHDEERAGIRPAERQMLRLLDVADFVHLTAVLRYIS